MDPQLLMMLLPLLLQGGGGGSSSDPNSGIDPSTLADMLGSINPGGGSPGIPAAGGGGLSALLSGLGGGSAAAGSLLPSLLKMLQNNSAVTGYTPTDPLQLAIQNQEQAGQGALAGSSFGPIGTLVGVGIGQAEGIGQDVNQGQYGQALANLLLGPMAGPLGAMLWPGAIPRTYKTGLVEQGLASSKDPISQMLADYTQNQILGKGDVLSSPGGDNFGKMAQVLEWLSGDSLPGLRSGEATIGGNQVPVPRDISRLQAMLGQSPDMSASEIQAFLPQIESLVSGGGTLKGLSGQIEAMINSVSGQKKAGLGGGNSSGGGNPLAAIFGGGGGGGGTSPSALNQLMEHFKTMSGGNSGNLVGASS